jgi:O-antigen ligase
LFSGFAFVLLSLAISGIPYDLASFLDYRALYLFAGLLFVALYIYFTRVSSFHSRVALARSFFYLGLFVTLQVFLFYADSPDVLQSISSRELTLAWGNPNSIAIILLMTIPMSMYLLSERRALFVLFPFIIIQFITLLFTLSRGSLLSFVIMFPFFMYLLVRESRRKLAVLIVIFITAGMVFLIQRIYPDEMTLLFERFATAGFDDSGRFELFAQGLSYFFQHPIFGVGFELPTLEYGAIVHFHSTFIQMAAFAGIFGLLAIVIHFDQKYTLVFKQKNHFFHWVGMVLLTTDLYGMIDVTYFSFIYMVYLGVLLGVTDSNAQIELTNNVQSPKIGT